MTDAEGPRSREAEVADLLDTIESLVQQACYVPNETDSGHHYDSMALSAYADGMRLLASYGRLRITSEYGRRVLGELVPHDERSQ